MHLLSILSLQNTIKNCFGLLHHWGTGNINYGLINIIIKEVKVNRDKQSSWWALLPVWSTGSARMISSSINIFWFCRLAQVKQTSTPLASSYLQFWPSRFLLLWQPVSKKGSKVQVHCYYRVFVAAIRDVSLAIQVSKWQIHNLKWILWAFSCYVRLCSSWVYSSLRWN